MSQDPAPKPGASLTASETSGLAEISTPVPQAERISLSAAHYSGPLPPPAMFEAYDRILPGAAERLLAYIEHEQQHRHEEARDGRLHHQTFAITGQVNQHFLLSRAQWMGLFIGTVGLAVAALIAWKGGTIPASLAALLDVAVLSGLYGRSRAQAEAPPKALPEAKPALSPRD